MGSKIGFLTGLTIFLLFAVPMFLEINKNQVTTSSVMQIAQEVSILTETEGGLTPRVQTVISDKVNHYNKSGMNLSVSVKNGETGATLAQKESPATTFTVDVSVKYKAWFTEPQIKSSASGIIMKR